MRWKDETMNKNLMIDKKVVAIDIVLENCQGMHFSIDDFKTIYIRGLQTNLSKSEWDDPCEMKSYLYASGGVDLTIKKEANRTDKLFLSHDDSRPPFDYLLHMPNIVRLCLVHEDESETRIEVPYEEAMGSSSWDEESIMQTSRLEDDGNLFIEIYGDADIEERKLANEEAIGKRKPRHDEKYYMNSKIKFTALQEPRTAMELLWMTERYFSEYGARLYRTSSCSDILLYPLPEDEKFDTDSPEADFHHATGYFNYVRNVFNIETVGELRNGERLT